MRGIIHQDDGYVLIESLVVFVIMSLILSVVIQNNITILNSVKVVHSKETSLSLAKNYFDIIESNERNISFPLTGSNHSFSWEITRKDISPDTDKGKYLFTPFLYTFKSTDNEGGVVLILKKIIIQKAS